MRMTAMRRRLDAMVVQEVCGKGCDCFVLVPGGRALQDILSNGWRPPPTTIESWSTVGAPARRVARRDARVGVLRTNVHAHATVP